MCHCTASRASRASCCFLQGHRDILRAGRTAFTRRGRETRSGPHNDIPVDKSPFEADRGQRHRSKALSVHMQPLITYSATTPPCFPIPSMSYWTSRCVCVRPRWARARNVRRFPAHKWPGDVCHCRFPPVARAARCLSPTISLGLHSRHPRRGARARRAPERTELGITPRGGRPRRLGVRMQPLSAVCKRQDPQ